MALIAVLTGDIIGSKSLSQIERKSLIELLSKLDMLLKPEITSTVEIFRGDSFQLRINNPIYALKYAIIIRALLRTRCYTGLNRQWDCRISIGIGHTEFEMANPGISDGEAYRLSGYGIDEMKKERLKISSPWSDLNEELNVTTKFADDIISHWTIKQSEAVLNKLRLHLSNVESAAVLNITRQAVDKLIAAAKLNLIELYLNRFHTLLMHKL